MASIQPISAGRFLQILCNVSTFKFTNEGMCFSYKANAKPKKSNGERWLFGTHEQLQYHKDAVLRSMLFCESIENPQLSLPYKVSELN